MKVFDSPLTLTIGPTPSWMLALAIFCGSFSVYVLSPVVTTYDSRWAIPVTLGLLDRGTPNLDYYAPILDKNLDLRAPYVENGKETWQPGVCPGGHYYNWFPVSVSVISMPVVAVLRKIAPIFWPLLLIKGQSNTPQGLAFLAGDFENSLTLVEVFVAAFFTALTVVVIFLIGRLFLQKAYSVALAMIFAFATPAWSIASRALWQHGPSMLMISIALYLLLLDGPGLVSLAGLPVALAYVLRPSNSLLVFAVTLYVAIHRPRRLFTYFVFAFPVAAAFLLYNEAVYSQELPPYFTLPSPFDGNLVPVFKALAGTILSPSRGLLVFTPIFLFSIGGMILALKRGMFGPLAWYLAAIPFFHWLVLGYYFSFWWGGHSYGARLFTDPTPLFVLFLIPILMKWRETPRMRAAFIVLVCVSVFIHSRGARSTAVWDWNGIPTNVDEDQSKIWDWRDPQFLRGL